MNEIAMIARTLQERCRYVATHVMENPTTGCVAAASALNDAAAHIDAQDAKLKEAGERAAEREAKLVSALWSVPKEKLVRELQDDYVVAQDLLANLDAFKSWMYDAPQGEEEGPQPGPTPTINVGDVVCLKAGGPLMTVAEIGLGTGQQGVRCEWHDKRGAPETRNYHPSMLRVRQEATA